MERQAARELPTGRRCARSINQSTDRMVEEAEAEEEQDTWYLDQMEPPRASFKKNHFEKKETIEPLLRGACYQVEQSIGSTVELDLNRSNTPMDPLMDTPALVGLWFSLLLLLWGVMGWDGKRRAQGLYCVLCARRTWVCWGVSALSSPPREAPPKPADSSSGEMFGSLIRRNKSLSPPNSSAPKALFLPTTHHLSISLPTYP